MTQNRSVVLALAALVFAFSSCSDYLSPVKGYLERYTEDAFIYGHGIATEYHVDGDGIDSVPSAGPATVQFWLRNPQDTQFTADIHFDDEAVEASRTEGACLLSVNASWTGIFLELSPAFLALHEGGGDLSGTVTLTEAETGRTLPYYRFALRSNSLPPVPVGPRVMLDSANKYVVCFNLDLSNSIHDDLASVTLNDSVWTVSSLTTGAVQSITFAESGASTTEPAGGLSPVADLDPFAPQSGMTPVYLSSSVRYVEDPDAAFTIGVRDRRDLLRSVITSTAGDQLVPVRFERHDTTEIPAGTFLTLPEDGAHVILVNTNPGSTVWYTVVTDGTVTQEQSFTESRRSLALPAGTSVITAYASLSGYMDSEPVTITVTTDTLKLSPVLFTTNDGTSIPAGNTRTLATGETPIIAVSPDTAATVRYTVNGGAEQTFTGAQEEIVLATGTHHITARATRTGYTDSDPVTIHVIIEEQLGPVTFTTSTGTTLAAGSATTLDGGAGGMATVTLSSPVSGATVRYTVNGGTVQTFTDAQYVLSLYAGSNTVLAWASQDGYANSDTVTISVTVTGTADVYVDNNTGVDANPGTQAEPCKTISGAYAKFPNKNNPTNRIVLLSDITTQDGTSGALANLVITETTQLAIECSGGTWKLDANAQNLRCLTVSGTGTLTLEITGIGFNNGQHPSAGAGIYVSNTAASVTLTDCDVAGNRIEQTSPGTATGAGIHFEGGRLFLYGSTTIEDNHISGAATAMGAGVYVINGSLDKTDTASINSNTMTGPTTGSCTLSGAGLYCDTFGSVTLTGGTINSNSITLNGTAAPLYGYGSGAYFKGGSRTLEDVTVSGNSMSTTSIQASYANGVGLYIQSGGITLNGCTISENTSNVVSSSNGTGINFNGSETLDLVETTITQNRGTCASGFGGGLYVGIGSQVSMTNGAITKNSANNRANSSAISRGDGVYINATATYSSTFTLNSGDISGNASNALGANTKTAFYLYNSYAKLILGAAPTDPQHSSSVQVDSSNVVFLNNGATIVADKFLTKYPVATLQFSNYVNGANVLSSSPENNNCNYYKFEVVPQSVGSEYCINANGELSPIESVDAGDLDTLRGALLNAPLAPSTRVINLTNHIVFNGGSLSTPKKNSHIRIHLAVNTTITVMTDMGGLFAQPASGESHLLIDGGVSTLVIEYITASYRTGPVFDVQQPGSSLVLRGVTIIDSSRDTGSPANAPLISATGARVMLENFTFDDTTGKDNSRFSAIMLANNSLCHFVSGEISGFNCSEANYGGVAHVVGNSRLYIHSGEFDDNSTVSQSSVTKESGGDYWLGTNVILR